jgi:hypothetical protein
MCGDVKFSSLVAVRLRVRVRRGRQIYKKKITCGCGMQQHKTRHSNAGKYQITDTKKINTPNKTTQIQNSPTIARAADTQQNTTSTHKPPSLK